MAFRGLTKKGADYLATRLANELAVEFLKVEIGDGAVVSGQNPKNQTSLISYKKDVRILKKEQENNAINLTIQITNDDITQGFYLKEIGIYVNDSTSNGCLYWYCNEDNAQYIPAKTDSVIAFEIDIRMEVTNSDATIINWSGKNTWINKDYLEENYTQNGGYTGTAQEIDDRVVSALGKEDGKFPLNEAVKGNVYYFPGNKKFYICKEAQNRRVSVPDGNFEELSIWENRKRLENLSKTKINITGNVPKNLLELNALANTLLKFSNQDSFSGLKNFEILAKDGTFFMRISKTPSFYIFEIFLQVSKYFVGTWYRDSELIFVQIS